MSEVVAGIAVAKGVAGSVLVNITSSMVYDIGKWILGETKSESEELNQKDIEEFVYNELENKYYSLCESGIVVNYLKAPLVKDTIYKYIVYKITGKIGIKTKSVVNNENNISLEEDEIIEFLTKNLIKCYEESETIVTKPNENEIRGLFKNLIELIYKYLYDTLGKEFKGAVFFINYRIDYFGNRLISQLKIMQDYFYKNLSEKDIIIEEDFEKLRLEYIDLIKDNHIDAHIYLLDKFKFNEFYVPPFLNNGNNLRLTKNNRKLKYRIEKQEEIFDDWKHIFRKNNIVYITGGAGYGKSLFMNKLIIDFENLNIFDSNNYLVIYGELKEFFENNSQKPMSVIDFLQNSMINETLLGKEEITKEFIQYYLNRGRCIILLDALDEVDKDKRDNLHSKVIKYFKGENPNNKICITSRSRGFIPEKEIEVFSIEQLDEIQIETYLDNIIKLGRFDKKDREAFLKQSKILVEKNFLCSFLVLSLLINIYKAERKLPANKVELYQKCFEYIGKQRETEKMYKTYNWEILTSLISESTFIELSKLCFPNNKEVHRDVIKKKLIEIYSVRYESQNATEYAVDEFLRFCSDRTELFVPSIGDEKFNFFHRSFFEYFYAKYVAIREQTPEKMYELLSEFDVDSEIFELTFAMIKQTDEIKYQKLIEYILSVLNDVEKSEEERLTALNILILGLIIIDEEFYKKQLKQFIISNKDFLIKNQNEITKVDSLSNLIIEQDKYLDDFNNVYKEVVLNKMLIIFSKYYSIAEKRANNLKNENGEIANKTIKDLAFIRYMEISLSKRFRHLEMFYMKPYFCKNNIIESIQSLESEELKNIFENNKTNKNDIKQINEVLNSYSNLEEKLKKRVDKVLCKFTD